MKALAKVLLKQLKDKRSGQDNELMHQLWVFIERRK